MLCPRCQNHMALDKETHKMRCPACGFRLFEDDLEALPSGNSEGQAAAPLSGSFQLAPGMINIDLTAGMDFSRIPSENEYDETRIRGKCYDALEAMRRHDYPGARSAFKNVLELAEQYSDAWLFLAAIA